MSAPAAGRYWQGAVGLLAALWLSACSVVELAYERAEWLLQREVARYIDLSPTQRSALDAAVAELRHWHQREALPQYAHALHELADALAEPLTAGDWADWSTVLERQLQQLLGEIQDRTLPLIVDLQPEQVEQFWTRLGEEHERRERRRRPEQALETVLTRDLQRQFRRWAGRPDAMQRTQLAAWAEGQAQRFRPVRDLQERYLSERRDVFRALLETRAESGFEARWHAYFEDAALPEALVVYQGETEVAIRELLATLSSGLSPRQRARLQQRVRDYALTAQRLADRAPE